MRKVPADYINQFKNDLCFVLNSRGLKDEAYLITTQIFESISNNKLTFYKNLSIIRILIFINIDNRNHLLQGFILSIKKHFLFAKLI